MFYLQLPNSSPCLYCHVDSDFKNALVDEDLGLYMFRCILIVTEIVYIVVRDSELLVGISPLQVRSRCS